MQAYSPAISSVGSLHAAELPKSPWFAIRVRPNFEKTAAAGLAARGFEQFFPSYKQSRKWSDRTKVSEFPLFPGYIFCRLDAENRLPVLSTPGVLGILSCGSTLQALTEDEIEAVRRVVAGNIPAEPWPYLAKGCRARVTHGVLAGVEGIVIDERSRCRLILQISLLQRSVSVQIDREFITPI